MMLRCMEGHGRVLHLGHYACPKCSRIYRSAPSACACSGAVFMPACAQCFAAQERGDESSVVLVYDEGPPGYAD